MMWLFRLLYILCCLVNIPSTYGSEQVSLVFSKSNFIVGKREVQEQPGQAEYVAGLKFLDENSVLKNDLYAVSSLEQAAAKGHIEAQYELAEIYYQQKEYKQAFYWFDRVFHSLRASSLKNDSGEKNQIQTRAAYRIGMMYYKAQEQASLRHLMAQYRLYKIYEDQGDKRAHQLLIDLNRHIKKLRHRREKFGYGKDNVCRSVFL